MLGQIRSRPRLLLQLSQKSAVIWLIVIDHISRKCHSEQQRAMVKDAR